MPNYSEQEDYRSHHFGRMTGNKLTVKDKTKHDENFIKNSYISIDNLINSLFPIR
jgi:hypothetical protein